MAKAHQRLTEHEGLIAEELQPSGIVVAHGPKAKITIAGCLSVDQVRHAKLLREASQLATAWWPFCKVGKMHTDPPFLEKSERFPRVLTLICPEDLNFQAPAIQELTIPGCSRSGIVAAATTTREIAPELHGPSGFALAFRSVQEPVGNCSKYGALM